MNRKLGQLIKAAVITLPLALPGVAFAQTAGTPNSSGTYDNADKQNQAPIEKNVPDKNAMPENSGVTTPPPEKTPPAGDLDTSGAAKPSDHNTGGDINKPSKMDNDTSHTKSKKDLDTGSQPGSDTNQ